MSDSPPQAPLDGLSKAILWAFLLFNLAIALSLAVSPGYVDAQYQGGAMTPTRAFQWFSIASFHLYMLAVTGVSLALGDPRERRWLHLANGGFYLWDAATQWAWWGAYVGVEPVTLHTNAGVSAAVGLALWAVAWRDRPLRRPSGS